VIPHCSGQVRQYLHAKEIAQWKVREIENYNNKAYGAVDEGAIPAVANSDLVQIVCRTGAKNPARFSSSFVHFARQEAFSCVARQWAKLLLVMSNLEFPIEYEGSGHLLLVLRAVTEV
jgi:hypothetical protein